MQKRYPLKVINEIFNKSTDDSFFQASYIAIVIAAERLGINIDIEEEWTRLDNMICDMDNYEEDYDSENEVDTFYFKNENIIVNITKHSKESFASHIADAVLVSGILNAEEEFKNILTSYNFKPAECKKYYDKFFTITSQE